MNESLYTHTYIYIYIYIYTHNLSYRRALDVGARLRHLAE